MRSAIVGILAALAASSAFAQPAQEEVPPACREVDPQGRPNWAGCAEAAAPGSGPYIWANINLGTQAYLDNNYAEAIRRYDMAVPPGSEVQSDAGFHAFRGAAYDHAGRTDEALADARLSARMMVGDPTLPASARQAPRSTFPPVMIYTAILPILKRGDAPEFEAALSAYRAMPATDWASLSNRASIMLEIGDADAAIADSAAALALEPGHPAVLNNQCYILTTVGRADEALSFCRRAVEIAPLVPQVRHSYAAALAETGDCAESQRQLSEARKLDGSSATYRQPLVCKARP